MGCLETSCLGTSFVSLGILCHTTYSGQQEQPVHVDGVNRYLSDHHIVYHVIIINNVFPSTAINLRRCMKYLLSVPIATANISYTKCPDVPAQAPVHQHLLGPYHHQVVPPLPVGHKHTKTHSPPPHQYNVPSYYVIYQYSKHLTTPTPRGQFPHKATCNVLQCHGHPQLPLTLHVHLATVLDLGGLHPTPKNAIS